MSVKCQSVIKDFPLFLRGDFSPLYKDKKYFFLYIEPFLHTHFGLKSDAEILMTLMTLDTHDTPHQKGRWKSISYAI